MRSFCSVADVIRGPLETERLAFRGLASNLLSTRALLSVVETFQEGWGVRIWIGFLHNPDIITWHSFSCRIGRGCIRFEHLGGHFGSLVGSVCFVLPVWRLHTEAFVDHASFVFVAVLHCTCTLAKRRTIRRGKVRDKEAEGQQCWGRCARYFLR